MSSAWMRPTSNVSVNTTYIRPRPLPPRFHRCMGYAIFTQGGVLVLSSGDDRIDNPGARVTLRNSSFRWNMADLDNGAVANVEKFASILVEGDGNVFEGNNCGADGGVFASTTDTLVTIEGGTFQGNTCFLVSQMFQRRCSWRPSPRGTVETIVSPLLVSVCY